MAFARSLVFCLLMFLSSSVSEIVAADQLVYFGTRKTGPGIGISVAHFDSATGALTVPQLVVEDEAPAYLLVDDAGRHLYVCNATSEFRDEKTGSVAAYAIERETGGLTLLNKRSSGAPGPCHISFDRTGHFLLGANYRGGGVFVIALLEDGSLGPRTAFVAHRGNSGVVPDRQEAPHPHSMWTDPGNRFALAPDLGQDRVIVYRFDAKSGALAANDPPFVALAPGAGPRHLAWSPDGRRFHVVNELAGTITTFTWDGARGAATELQTIRTLPDDFHDANTSAEIVASRDGRFVYATNRGHDSIAVLAVEPRDGTLDLVERVPSRGHNPRYLELHASGDWAIVTNHDSDNATVYRVDRATGRLTPVGDPVAVPHPYGVRFVPLP